MLVVQEIYQERVVHRRQAEFNRLRKEKEDRISRILESRRQERERMRKFKFYLNHEEERLRKLHEEEEARRREGNYSSIQSVHCLETWHCLSMNTSRLLN